MLDQHLRELGVEIDQFEDDDFHSTVVEGEIIQTDNQIEHLF